MNNYIVTSNGFIKDIYFDKKTLTRKIEYTKHLRYAKLYSSKQAQNIIDKWKLEAFVYNPWKEEPIREKYEVVLQQSYNLDFGEVPIYIVRRAIMEKETDAKFLQNKKLTISKLYSFDDANIKVKELNSKMFKNLEIKLLTNEPH